MGKHDLKRTISHITELSVPHREKWSKSTPTTGREPWVGKQRQTRSQNWWHHSLESNYTARMLPKGQRCHQINTEKQQITFSADQSGWGWARCLWAWRSLLYWLHRGCISRILSTLSGDTEPLLGSPQMCAPHAGASHLSLSAPPCHPSCIEKRFALKAQWILNMYQSALTLKWNGKYIR